jgi:hypothetical protein
VKGDPKSEIMSASDLERFMASPEYLDKDEPVLYMWKVVFRCLFFIWTIDRSTYRWLSQDDTADKLFHVENLLQSLVGAHSVDNKKILNALRLEFAEHFQGSFNLY